MTDPIDPIEPTDDARDRVAPGSQPLAYLLAGLMAGAGIIHLVMVPIHAGGSSLLDPLAFAAAGWFQLAVAAAILTGSARRWVFTATVVANLAMVGVWVWSRTAGLPVGSHAGVAEDVGTVDLLCVGLELAAVALAGALLLARHPLRTGVLAPALGAVAVLGLTTTVIVAPDTAEHGGHTHGEAADDHHGGTDHVAEMAALDRRRCDLGFNPTAFWQEAEALGVDTYAGGAMAPHDTSDGSLESVVGSTQPLGGRGSPGLDRLISATSAAGGGEVAAAQLVVALSGAEDEDYRAWQAWMRASSASGAGGSGHDHGGSSSTSSASSAAPDDNAGHGGHAGPQPWIAMTDQRQCVQLAQELQQARDVTGRFETAADAMAAGYSKTTTYVPGIASHYIKYDLVDDTFDIAEPEMILYDGEGPDAHVVGLSYYLLHEGDAEPSQGFTGPNDHFHRHVGLCRRDGLVIGDSTTSEEDCRARGGEKADGGNGWMNHVWVVPGCESPWGMFSGASPLLDVQLAKQSGDNDGGCSASSVRDRYDLSPGGSSPPGRAESAAGD